MRFSDKISQKEGMMQVVVFMSDRELLSVDKQEVGRDELASFKLELLTLPNVLCS